MKILLTGATGFLGKNLKPILAQSYDVFGIGSDWDLRDQDQCHKLLANFQSDADVIVHAAGTVGGIGANKENPGRFMYDNLIMGANLIHEAMKQQVSKFILLGTVCAYPKHTPVPFEEKDIWNGYPEETNAPYGIAKKTLMRLLEAYHEQYGMGGVNLIPVNMYGPHDRFNLTSSHVIPALILKIDQAIKQKAKSITLWGTGQASREFLYAPDCAEAIKLAIEKDIWNGYPEETNAPYGIAKKTLMRLLEAYHEQYGMGGVNLIPVNMYGPHDHFNLTSSHVIPALILKVDQAIEQKAKSITLWGTGQASREFLYAPDCAEAIKLSIETDISPTPINIGTGKEIKICNLIETICDIMAFDGEILYDTSKPDGQPRRCLDTSKAEQLLGFKARTALRDGLTYTIKWFKETVSGV